MPYISQEDREHIESFDYLRDVPYEIMGQALRSVPSEKTKGAFNYFVTRLWFETFQPKGYTDTSDAIAVFADIQHELRRRVLDPYEDSVIEKNGDVEGFPKPIFNWDVK